MLKKRWQRILILLLGTLLPQVVLYGPCLLGSKLILPLDILGLHGFYLPLKNGKEMQVVDPIRTDPVLQIEIFRQLAVSEVRAGRWPLWNPYAYCGSPLLANNQSAVFSPYRILDYFWPDPRVLAWDQLLQAMVAGAGAFAFFRRTMRTSYWPSCIGAWCFPLCGFLMLWNTWPLSSTASFLPWILLGVDRVLHTGKARWIALLSISTTLCLFADHAETATSVLVGAAVFGMYQCIDQRPRFSRIAMCVGSVVIGAVMSMPQSLPTLAYLQESYRFATGHHDTPAAGWKALPQFVFPFFNGSTHSNTFYLLPNNLPESASAGYAGLILFIVGMPFAFVSRRRRVEAIFLTVAAIIAASQVLGIPLISRIYDLPGLSSMRSNRMVLWSGFAMLSIGVIGLDAWVRSNRSMQPRLVARPGLAGIIAGVVLSSICVYRVVSPPDDIQRFLAMFAASSPADYQLRVHAPQWFTQMYITCCITAAVATMVSFCMAFGLARKRLLVGFVALFSVGELTLNAWPHYARSDPSLYYQRIPALMQISKDTSYRVIGADCLPANFAATHQLRDLTGYDAIDPTRLVELLLSIRNPSSPQPYPYAKLQWLVPKYPHRVLDMLSLRYVIARGTPPAGVQSIATSDDYYITENECALPRVYLPRRAEIIPGKRERVGRLLASEFDPSDVVVLERNIQLPPPPYSGSAKIVEETPTRIVIDADHPTSCVLVLSDLYSAGWKASWNNSEVEVLRANHAIRAVVLPRGKGTLIFTYAPAAFTYGLTSCAMGVITLIGLCTIVSRQRRIRQTAMR